MPDRGDTPDVLRRILEAAREQYAQETQQDPRCFDFDAATELIFNMTGPAPQATVKWLYAIAHLISAEHRGGDLAAQSEVYAEACKVLHETLTKPTTTN